MDADTEVWARLRRIRRRLADAAEDGWSRRLRDAMAPTASGAPPDDLAACLRELRGDALATRLGLVAAIDEVLVSLPHEPTAPPGAPLP